MKNIFFYQTDIGKIAIASKNNAVTNLYFNLEKIPDNAVLLETEVLKEAGRQLLEYFSGKLKYFSLPLAPLGTEFMLGVWKNLQVIPYGETRSYKQIAENIGNNKAYRAVGNANNRNPIPIIVPCHRVIGSNGNPVGYAGGLQIKAFLLDLEKDNK